MQQGAGLDLEEHIDMENKDGICFSDLLPLIAKTKPKRYFIITIKNNDSIKIQLHGAGEMAQ